jgi:hypothetical protein
LNRRAGPGHEAEAGLSGRDNTGEDIMQNETSAHELACDELEQVAAGKEFTVVDFGGVQIVLGESSMYVCGPKQCTHYDW